jgi:hypothetical protein
MKKIVFLMLLVLVVPHKTNAAETRTYDLENYKIIIEDIYLETGKGFTIEKQGVSPFLATHTIEGRDYNIKGVKNYNDLFIVYGSVHIHNVDTYYDAVFIVFNEAGELISEDITDHGDLEENEDIFFLDGVYILQTTEHTDISGDIRYKRNHFTLYDENFNIINHQIINTEINNISFVNNYLLFSYDYDDFFEFGFDSSLNIIEHDDRLDILQNEIFFEPLYLNFINDGILNGDTISNGHKIDYPGNYKFIYNKNEYNFILKSNVSGITCDSVYTDQVMITFDYGNATLNNDIYLSGSIVSKPGYYQFLLSGANGYVEECNFTITSNMDGVSNNNVYDSDIEVIFNGEGYLNNQFVNSPLHVKNDGDYILKIRGENDYLETYFFTLEEGKEDVTFINFIQKFDIVILIVVSLSTLVILKKK